MAIIVDKAQKRKDIALSCRKLFVDNGIKDLTVSQVAKSAGVGKGTIYEYFVNKEDIIFEIVTVLMQEHNIKKQKKIMSVNSTKEKIKIFFEFFYNDEYMDLRTLYQEFIAIALTNPNEEIIQFQTNCFENYYDWVVEIIQDGIDKGEIIASSKQLIKSLFALGDGMFILNISTNTIKNLEEEINEYIDTLFELIKVKKQ